MAPPVLISPAGTISTTTPVFTWNASAGATNYFLELSTSAAPLFRSSYTAATACVNQICTAAPGRALASGTYYWAVEAQNGPDKAWSDSYGFTVPPPPAPVPISPNGAIYTPTPTYRWNKVTGTDVAYYVLSVDSVEPTGTPPFTLWLTPAEACSGATCAVTPTLPQQRLCAGTYFWQLQARTTIEAGPWSSPVTISPQGPPPPTPLTPNGPGTMVTPYFMWTAVAGGEVTRYRLSMWWDGDASVYTQQYDVSVCAGSYCGVKPAFSFATGAYRWDVIALNAVGPSIVVGSLPFTVAAPAPPAPISPQGLVPSLTPTFTWAVSPGALDYTISVLKPNGSTVYEVNVGRPCTKGGVCSATPPLELTVSSSYLWRVRGQHTSGIGEWSGAVNFRVASPYLEEDCTGDFVSADFDGNGEVDRLCRLETIVYVALADGTGGYGLGRPWLVHAFTRLLAGDFDGDGKADLADVNVETGDFLVARSTGSVFNDAVSWGIARATWGGTSYTCQGSNLVAGTGSFNSDARADVYCLDANVRLFLGQSTGSSFQFSIPDDLPPGVVPVQEYIYSGSRPLAITGAPQP